MDESELRFALHLLAHGGDSTADVPDSESFRRESLRLAERSRPWVLGTGVQGVGLGEKISDGTGTGVLALRVYVETKRPLAQLDAPVPRTVEVPEFGELTTDVLEIGRLRPERFTGRVRPAMPGSGVSHPDCGVGTFGCVVRETGNGSDRFILSNAHVLADDGCAHPGDAIVQPGPDDGGDPGSDVIAAFARAEPFVFSDEGFENRMDAAIARVLEPHQVRRGLRVLRRPIRGVARVLRRGMEVMKVGRTTDHTVGVVQDVDFHFPMDYKRPGHRSEHFARPGHGERGRVGFRDQVLCTRYTDVGDSGAAVLNRRGYLLGLHFAGSPAASVFSPIRPIFRALRIDLERDAGVEVGRSGVDDRRDAAP
ncbi:MAG: hypothetical protein HKN71_08430 [Gemmatimonadetes bacterium]|nr:hypothetical protein [Gemmatimonadota bacterium]